MDTRRPCLVLLALLLPVVAHADRHKIGFRGAGANAGRSSLWGIQFSTDYTLFGEQHDHDPQALPPPTKLGTLSAVLELSMVAGTHEKELLLSQFTGLMGLRYSFNGVFGSHIQPFVQGQLGFAREREADVRRNLAAFALGVGVHIPLGPTSANHHPPIGLCIQYDQYGIGTSPTDWYPQISVGFVLRVTKLK